MRTLLWYEIKKILMKKSNIVAFGILFAIQIFFAISGSLGSTYVDDIFVETHMERNRIDREYGIAMSGSVMDDELLLEVKNAYEKVDYSNREYLLSEVYQTEVRKYADIIDKLKSWGLRNLLSDDRITEGALYECRESLQNAMWENYELSEGERKYWLEKENELKKPFVYEYCLAFEMITSMTGVYMTCMLITFFISISMVNVFMEEHNRKTDQLLLCTRYGRKKLYLAKLLAGGIVVFVANLLLVLVDVAGNFFSYGMEGFNAMIQGTSVFWYSYDLSLGKTALIVIGLLLLSSVMAAVFTMVLAEILHHSVGAMAVMVGGLFAARLVSVPVSWGFISQLWNYIPINLLKIDQGFTDLRLVPVFGVWLTSWQFAPILYVLVIAAAGLIGSRIYIKYQVSGR